MSSAAAASLLSAPDVAAIHRLQLDGLATAIALGGFPLVLYRVDDAGVAQPLAPVTVARRWANRQPQAAGSEAAAADWVTGDFRAFAPWDVAVGDTFTLPEGPGKVVPALTTKDGITTAPFALDQGAP